MASVPLHIDNPAESRPLVSNTSILLFSAFLAGIAFGQALPHAAQFHAIAASAAGTIAYIGLWYSTRVKEQQASNRVNRQLTRRLERKLGKHVTARRMS